MSLSNNSLKKGAKRKFPTGRTIGRFRDRRGETRRIRTNIVELVDEMIEEIARDYGPRVTFIEAGEEWLDRWSEGRRNMEKWDMMHRMKCKKLRRIQRIIEGTGDIREMSIGRIQGIIRESLEALNDEEAASFVIDYIQDDFEEDEEY